MEVAAAKEFVVGQIQGRGGESRGADRCPWSHDDAIWVDQVDLAIGPELTQQCGGIRADDAIEDRRGR